MRALKGDLKLSFLILLATFITADHFLYTTKTTSWELHFLGQVIAIVVGYLLSKQLFSFYRLTG
ncbi:MAG: hypothetical protein ABEI52_05645 [Halobacteriaceae archaeon]